MLIGLRNGLMAGKRLSAKSYVQDGLVAMWDGIENAGWGVHDPNATTWKNLAGENDLTKYSYASWGTDALVCDGSGVGASGLFAFDLSSMSMTCCVSDLQDTTGVRNFICTPSSATVNSGCCGVQVNGNTAYMTAYFGILKSSKMSITMRGNNMAAFTTGNPSSVIVNGNNLSRLSYQSVNNSGRYCSIGARRNSNGGFAYPCGGKVHNLRIYSRILTAEEIAANYAVDATRFNLPDAS